jgi:hypothetical protein
LARQGSLALAVEVSALGEAVRERARHRLGLDLGGIRRVTADIPDDGERCLVRVEFAQSEQGRGAAVARSLAKLVGGGQGHVQIEAETPQQVTLAFPVDAALLQKASRALAGWLEAVLSLPPD